MSKASDKKAQLDDIDEVFEDTSFLEQYSVEDPWGRARTGTLLLDLQAGGKKGVLGYPYGWIVNYVGDKSSGKTLFAHEVTAYQNHINKGFKYLFMPTEYGDSFDTEDLYNYNATMPWEDVPKTVQKLDTTVREFLDNLKVSKDGKTTESAILTVDSLDGVGSIQLDNMAEDRMKKHKAGKEVKDDGSYQMEKPKFLSMHHFPKIACELRHKKALYFILSQLRDNPDPNSPVKEKRSGGRAMDFFSHTVQWLYAVQKIFATEKAKKNGKSCGGITRVVNKKSKTSRPGRIIYVLFYYTFGIDDVGTNLIYLKDLLSDKGQMTVKNPVFDWNGEERKFLEIRDWFYLEENKAERNKLDQMVIERWEKEEDAALKAAPGAGALRKYR
jgi:RecA/RadA recombinase